MKDKIIESYDNIVLEYVKHEFNNPLMHYHYDRFLSFLPEHARILDVGCGPGEACRRFSEMGHVVVGIDLSKNMIRHAQKICPEAKFYLMDAEEITLEQKFDAIWATLILCHVPRENHLKVFQRFNEMLEEDGILFLGMLEGKSAITMPEIYNKEYTQYFVYVSQQEVEAYLERSGFKLLEYSKELVDKQGYKFTLSFFYARKQPHGFR